MIYPSLIIRSYIRNASFCVICPGSLFHVMHSLKYPISVVSHTPLVTNRIQRAVIGLVSTLVYCI